MKYSNPFAKCALVLAIGLLAAQVVLAETAEDEKPAEGFIEGSTLSLLSRNYYFNRDYRNVPGGDQSFREEWAQGEMLEYKSGYTQGVIGVGVDVFGYAGFKLDSGKGRSNHTGSIIGLLPTNDDGEPDDNFGEAGAAVKLRMSATELKYGQMRTAAPVFATGDAFLLPETATGFLVTSSDFTDLVLEAGHFTAFNDYNSTNSNAELKPAYGSGKPGSTISFGGASYTVNDNVAVMFYGSHFEDSWNQYFVNANYGIPFSENQKLVFDANVYRTLDTGTAYQGEINNTTYSIKSSYTFGINTLALAYQHVHGDTPFDYVGWDSIWLANSNQFSDFNAPNEKAVSLGYTIDLGEWVASGLTAEAKYTRGDNIDGTQADPTGGYAGYYGNNGKHWERDFDIKYVVQSGSFKDLSMRLRQATHRGNADQGDGAIDEVRFMVEFPYDIL